MIRGVVLSLAFIVTTLSVLIANAPLAAVLSFTDLTDRGVSYGGAYGTVWDGRVTAVSTPRQVIGDVRAKISPMDLLRGQLHADLRMDGPALSARAILAGSANGRIVAEQVTMLANLEHLQALHPRMRTPGARFEGQFDKLVWDQAEGCVEARGTLHTDALTQLPTRGSWTGPALNGTVTCDGSSIVFELAGAQANFSVTAKAVVEPTGQSDIRVELETDIVEIVALALSFGFEENQGVYIFTRQAGIGAGV